MKIHFSGLQSHLSSPKPVWLIAGDEPLQMQEAGEALRVAAVKAGYGERVCIDTEASDWIMLLTAELQALSLLSPKRLLEVDLRTVRLTPAQGKTLAALSERIPPDILLLIFAGRPGAGALPAWMTACERAGVMLQVWPVAAAQLPGWILQRATAMGLSLQADTAKRIAKLTEGNLPAAAGMLEKILLWCGDAGDTEKTKKALAAIRMDCSQHDIFQLADAALSGQAEEALHILKRLWLSTEPVLILWAIVRDLRLLIALQTGYTEGIFQKRKPLFSACFRRHTQQYCLGLLQQAAHLDRIIKGAPDSAGKPDPHSLMEKLLCGLAGTSR